MGEKGTAYFDYEAVHVKDGDTLSFHPSKMEEGKMYAAYWKGETWAVQKNGFSIRFYTIHDYNIFERFLQKIKKEFSTAFLRH